VDQLNPSALESYLHAQIPLTAAMGVRVLRVDLEGIELGAPLAPNRNHQGTAFGGGIAALALAAAWSVAHAHVVGRTPAPAIVVAEQRVRYLEPAEEEMRAFCAAPGRDAWRQLDRALERRGRGRIELQAEVRSGGRTVARFEGSFVALGG